MRWLAWLAACLLAAAHWPTPATATSITKDEQHALANPVYMATCSTLVKSMFFHGYSQYLLHAFPGDELRPVSCKPRARGFNDDRGDADMAMGGYPLQLIDALDTLVVMREYDEFMKGVYLVAAHTNFDKDFVVSVFEVTIRTLGGLLSAHVLAEDITRRNLAPGHRPYRGELLPLASDLGTRLLRAFATPTGVPTVRIHLQKGLVEGDDVNVCYACAGTLLLEFATLSRLTSNPVFEEKARHALTTLYAHRHPSGLVGRLFDTKTGNVSRDCSIGAGIDSYYEYLLKGYIATGEPELLRMFDTHYAAIMATMRRGSFYAEVDGVDPRNLRRPHIDSLMAFWPGLQVLYGDIAGALDSWELLYQVARRNHGLIPEMYSRNMQAHDLHYFLRPEFAESTWMLYRATKSARCLEAGKLLLQAIEDKTTVDCGYAALANLRLGQHDDRMDSFFLAETLKYLYLLFEDGPVGVNMDGYELNTEAHLLPLLRSPGRESKGQCPNGRWPDKMLQYELLGRRPVNITTSPATHEEVHAFLARFEPATMQWDTRTLAILEHLGIWVIIDGDRVSLTTVDGMAVDNEAMLMGRHVVQTLDEYWRARPTVANERLRKLEVYMNSEIHTTLEAYAADFGADLLVTGPLNGTLVVAAPDVESCKPCDRAVVAGHVVMTLRGGCTFMTKARHLQRAGAVGVVVADNADSSELVRMAADDADAAHDPITIPAVFIASRSAFVLLKLMDQNKAPLSVSLFV